MPRPGKLRKEMPPRAQRRWEARLFEGLKWLATRAQAGDMLPIVFAMPLVLSSVPGFAQSWLHPQAQAGGSQPRLAAVSDRGAEPLC